METINLALQFVKSGSPQPDPPVPPTPVDPGGQTGWEAITQSGDPLLMLIILLVFVCAATFIYFIIRKLKSAGTYDIASSEKIYAFKLFKSYIPVHKKIFMAIIVSILIALTCIAMLTLNTKAYGEINKSLTRVVNIVVQDDGTMTIPKTEITNDNNHNLALKSSMYQISDASVKEILAESNLEIQGLGGIVFKGGPETEYTIDKSLRHFESGSTETLDISFSLKNPKDALSLCGKAPINIAIKYENASVAIASIDLGDAIIDDKSKIPTGWTLNNNLYTKEFDLLTSYKTILQDWYTVDYSYPWYTLSGFTPDEGFLTEHTTFYAQWNLTPPEKPLGEYTWSELKMISEDIASNYDEAKVSTSIYYEKFDQFANEGQVKEIPLTNGASLTVRILGINHDNKGNGEKAGLTFAAVHSLSSPYSYDSGLANNWNTSDLRNTMNSAGGSIYALLPQDLKVELTKVSKSYSKGWDENRWEFSTEQNSSLDKLWLASATELGWVPPNNLNMISDCGVEGELYKYYNKDPYQEFRTDLTVNAGPLLTILTEAGYKYVSSHKQQFSGVWDIFSYCKANGLLIDSSISMTRSLERVQSTTELEDLTGINYFKGITMRGDFEETDCPANLKYAVVPCFSLGNNTEDRTELNGTVTYSDPAESGHTEKMKAGLHVFFTYKDGKSESVLSGVTDKNGNYTISNVPLGVTGTLSFNNMGYYVEEEIQKTSYDKTFDLTANGPYLEFYTWDEIRSVSDEIVDGGITDDLYNEFKNHATKGAVKKVTLNEGTTKVDNLYVRIIGFEQDYKSNPLLNDKVGITFMAVNSLNSIASFTELTSTKSSYTTSLISQSLNNNGEIYNGLPLDLKNNIIPVVKDSEAGWNLLTYSDEIEWSLNNMFVPSMSELGFAASSSYQNSEKYEYISSDPYTKFSWHADITTPMMTCANAYGYNWILENGAKYSNAEDLYADAALAGAFPEYIVPPNSAQWIHTRNVNGESVFMVRGLSYDGSSYDNINRAYGGATIAPCFCVGSKGRVPTTYTVSGKVTVPTSLFNKGVDLDGLEVILEYADSRYGDALIEKTDSDGEFTFHNVPAFSTVNLMVSGRGYSGYIKDLYIDEDKEDIELSAKGPTLEGYSWEELKYAATEFSNGTISAEKRKVFEDMAERGDLKMVPLTRADGTKDCIYVRIAGFCQDDLSSSSKKAGITFIAANSINQQFFYDDMINVVSNATYCWKDCTLRESLNNGEIYNMFPDSLKELISTVNKKSVEGWEDSGDWNFKSNIIETDEKIFIPSFSELGIKDLEPYQFDEGDEYKYINKDPYKTFTKFTPERPCLAGLNYLGLEYLLNKESLEEYSDINEVYDDCANNGGTIINWMTDDSYYYTCSRSIPSGLIFCHGIYSDSVIEPPADKSMAFAFGTTVAPCFCL